MADLRKPALTGRAQERLALERLLDTVRGGRSGVLVIRGEAGVGKTALLRYCASRATGCHVVQIAGVQSELELPFAALQQLCVPMIGQAATLPEPQQHALAVAFGSAAGPAPDRLVLGLGVLGLLAESAAERPLVCLIDDAQWLDEASSQILAFVGRRLLAESVLLLCAIREPADEWLLADLPDITIEGLSDADARALLAATIPGKLDEQVRDRLISETRGNPLALLELPTRMSRAELAGGFAVHSTTRRFDGLDEQLEDHYMRRIQALPAQTQQLMLVAAADPTGDAALLWRAAQTLGIPSEAMAPAVAARLFEVGSRVQFRHPLVRSAAYAAATSEQRRAAHMALAAATDPETDRERRVWHLAAAATCPDEEVACELERTAEKAQVRGGLPAAAAFLHRAVALTADPAQRTERALAAAHASLHAGSFDAALSVLATAEAHAADDLQRARVNLLRGQVDRAASSGREAPAALLRSAERLETLDIGLARETYLDAWGAAHVADSAAQPGGRLLDVSAAARSAPPAQHDPQPGDLLLDGLAALVIEGHGSAAPTLRRAVDAFLRDELSADQWLHWGVLVSIAALALWDSDSWAKVSARHAEHARASGALAPLVGALNMHRVTVIRHGDLEAAALLGMEEDIVKEVTGTRRASYGALFLAAYRGRPAESAPLFAAIVSDATARGEGLGSLMAHWATAVLHNGLGHYKEALVAAEKAVDDHDGPFTALVLPELVESAVRSGAAATADEALEQLASSTVAAADWGAGTLAQCRAMLGEGVVAEARYAEAIERLGRTRLRLDLARAQLLYGEWLRREGRRVDARTQLRSAHAMFVEMGTDGFAERARRELLATGEKIRKRQADIPNELTPQEEYIARLARDGHTNNEIGAQLFISDRTVEWHLRKVFDKLEITSRKDLRNALPIGGHTPASQLLQT
ncbi:AAA family ATPase [Nocardia sp. NPDC050710]|uniref:helix-turn-helix transcriptional regulator n=1 Tax=Nocardia sp. NPDC050710 TaxID=3157220 RepID=UPI0033EDF3A7